MTYWFTSDSHHFHSNILNYCDRPYDTIEEMDEDLIRRWNGVVKEDDTVFHLGDFCFGDIKKYTSRLNGNIILVKGNHDDKSESIIDHIVIKYFGLDINLIHDYREGSLDYDLILCGHLHELWKIKRLPGVTIVNVGVDVWDYTPVNMKSIIKFIKKNKENE